MRNLRTRSAYTHGMAAPPNARPPGPTKGRRLLRALARVVALLFVGGMAYTGWYFLRPIPKPGAEELFRGVHYVREVRDDGTRRAIVHTVVVDNATPGVSFFVTPGDPSRALPLVARTPSALLREYHLQVVVNGDFFSPWYSNNPFDFYPHEGDPVEVDGYAASDGVVYSKKTSPGARTLRFYRDGRVSLRPPRDDVLYAISGEAFIDDGVFVTAAGSVHDPEAPLPRTAIGLDERELRLFVFVVDGRQPRYSAGLALRELAEVAIRAGARDVVNLDGGGSSALVAEDGAGKVRQLSTPIHTRIPGRERPVANHLGIRALPLHE